MKKSGIVVDTTAADASGMTLGELEGFVRDARTAGVPDEARVKVRATWKARVRMISAASSDVAPAPQGGDE
ncbi:MAG: hypothetical protein HOY78_02305 [Saccharothrix sp.]|nr:hypothetical protein [Saccharothrix sp.]